MNYRYRLPPGVGPGQRRAVKAAPAKSADILAGIFPDAEPEPVTQLARFWQGIKRVVGRSA